MTSPDKHNSKDTIKFKTPSNPEDKANQVSQKNKGTNDDLEGRKYSYHGHENKGSNVLDEENNISRDGSAGGMLKEK